MLIPLILATTMVVLKVLIHGAGRTALARGLRIETNDNTEHHHFSLERAVVVLVIVLALFTLHSFEIWLYAAVYLLIVAVQLLGCSTAFFVTVVARLPN